LKPRSEKAAAAKSAELQRKTEANELAQLNAEVESARVRAMFDEDRQRFARRYGVATLTAKD
jgi:hypothetical protein